MTADRASEESGSPSEDVRRRILDEEHLRLLALFHYISGALTIAFASLFIFHLMFIVFAMNNPEIFGVPQGSEEFEVMPQQLLGIFAAFIGSIVIGGIIYGIVQIVSGRFISRRHYRTFSFIAVFPNILLIPYGTLLAIFTLIVLERPSVKALYADQQGRNAQP
jgi:hypothetical protein